MKQFDWLIVGAGFTGAVLAERIASQLGQRVLLIDRRNHFGGNAYDCPDSHGILIQKYGAHIFHTNSARIWDYLSQFTGWRPYVHRVLAMVEGKTIPLPFNLNSLAAIFPRGVAERLEQLLLEGYGAGASVPVLRMIESSSGELRELARYIYRNVFENYTFKQWGLTPGELDSSVTARVPVMVSRDDRYFHDAYQGIPKDGYTELFRRLLAHPNIHVELNCGYHEGFAGARFRQMIFTGPIDEFFGEMYGSLPYRSIQFQFEHQSCDRAQEVAVVNYPNEHAFTRIVEYKHLSGQVVSGTTIAREFPEPYRSGVNEPYYPIPREENRERYLRYARAAEELQGKVIFAGRLADYKYYNMDQAVGRALKVFEGISAER